MIPQQLSRAVTKHNKNHQDRIVRFIEEWFGIWPDNGDGSLEILILVVLVALAALIGMLLPIGGKPKEEDLAD